MKETCSVSSDRLCDNPCPEQACGCGREGGVQAVASTEKYTAVSESRALLQQLALDLGYGG